MPDKFLRNQKGEIMVEAMVAISIAVVGLLGIFSFLSQSLGLNKTVGDRYTAVYLASEGIELVKNLADAQSNWGDLPVCSDASPCQIDYTGLSLGSGNNSLHFDGTHYYHGGTASDLSRFTRKIILTYPQPDEIKVISRVEWSGRGGGSFKVDLEDHFFNLQQSAAAPAPAPAPAAGPFDYTLAANPVSGSVAQGKSIATTIAVTQTAGTAQAVSFSGAGFPPLKYANQYYFSPTSCTPSAASPYTCASVLTMGTYSAPTGSTPPGTYNIVITGLSADGLVSKTTNYALTVVQAYTLYVSKAGAGNGTVTSGETPPIINCGLSNPTCYGKYGSGDSAILTATPANGSVFAGWSGDVPATCTASPAPTNCAVTVDAAKNVTAAFNVAPTPPATYKLTINQAGDGVGSVAVRLSSLGGALDLTCTSFPCSKDYAPGTVLYLIPNPSGPPSTIFPTNGWSGCDSVSGSNNRYCAVTLSADKSPSVTFDQFDFSVAAVTVPSPATVTKGAPVSATITATQTIGATGQTVNFSAIIINTSGVKLSLNQNNCSTAGAGTSCSVTLTADTTNATVGGPYNVNISTSFPSTAGFNLKIHSTSFGLTINP